MCQGARDIPHGQGEERPINRSVMQRDSVRNTRSSSKRASLTKTPTVVVYDGFYMTRMIHLPLFLKKEQVVGTSVLSGCCKG